MGGDFYFYQFHNLTTVSHSANMQYWFYHMRWWIQSCFNVTSIFESKQWVYSHNKWVLIQYAQNIHKKAKPHMIRFAKFLKWWLVNKLLPLGLQLTDPVLSYKCPWQSMNRTYLGLQEMRQQKGMFKEWLYSFKDETNFMADNSLNSVDTS